MTRYSNNYFYKTGITKLSKTYSYSMTKHLHMNRKNHLLRLSVFILLLTACLSFSSSHNYNRTILNGAWQLQGGDYQEVAMFSDGYCMISYFDKQNKKLHQTYGGTYQLENNMLTLTQEFNSRDKEMIGHPVTIPIKLDGDIVSIETGGNSQKWKRVDNGTGPLAGVWRSGGRMQDGKVTYSPLAARKTFKMLTGTRFQWTAMNTDTKEMLGTGGGTYTFVNGKYTENLEFFSRDSSRVGASLTFDAKVENDNLHQAGLNSRGQQMSEIWGKVKL
jgi:hypothetical protein